MNGSLSNCFLTSVFCAAQIWQACADVTITANPKPPTPRAHAYKCHQGQCIVDEGGSATGTLNRTECEAVCKPLNYVCDAGRCVEGSSGGLDRLQCEAMCS